MTMPSRETVAEAAAWITRLHGSRRSPEVEAAFREWLSARPEHAQAFEGMTEIWDTAPAVSQLMSRGQLSRLARWEEPQRSRRWGLVTAALALCAIGAVVGYGLAGKSVYKTGIGEQRIVNLQDGSRVFLNATTYMTVDYSEATRRIVLRSGEAFFEVAPHASRPFVVDAGDRRVTVLGTAFAVRHEQLRTTVTLVEGKVAVGSVELEPGQRLVEQAGEPPRIDTPSIEVVTAWRRGEVIMDEMPLSEAVAEMNRYDKAQLLLGNSGIGELPVSGIYRTGDNSGFARIVAEMYGLSVREENGRIRLELKS